MPKTTFASGTTVTPEFLNAINNPVFDGQDIDGHRTQITDEELSSAATSVKTQWRALRDTFLVSAGTWPTITINGGTVLKEDNTIQVVAATSRTVPASSTIYVWIDTAGVIQTGANLPVRCTALAAVVSTTNSFSSITDLRTYYQIMPQMRAVSVFGGNSNNDIIYSSNATITSGLIEGRNITVNAGVTLTVPAGYLKITASGDVNIAGTINVTPPIAGGSGFVGGGRDQYYFAESGRGLGGGGGHNSPPAAAYPHTANAYGSSGASGFGSVTSGSGPVITISKGGPGGGVLLIEAAGTISISGSLLCQGGAATPGTAASPGASVVVLTGGGGGSGGLIWLRSLANLLVTPAGTLNVRGGNGANGYRANYAFDAAGGGGGGGGRIVCQAPAINLTASTTLLTGGDAGLGTGGGVGVAGSVGGSFGGVGGGSNTAGSIGQLTTQLVTPS
jgi:hypothetical protein